MARGMHIVLGVRVQMVMAVLRRPPEDALLGRALGESREHELECSAGRKGSM